jgi:hypothetical protein
VALNTPTYITWGNETGVLPFSYRLIPVAPVAAAPVSGNLSLSVDSATTATPGVVTLAPDGGVTAGTVVQGNDTRMSNARTPDATHLQWSTSGHVGAGDSVAGWDAGGAATVLAIGGDLQAYSADLDGIAGLAGTGLLRKTAGPSWTLGTGVSTAEIADDAVTFAKIQNLTTNVIAGRITAGSGDMESLTPAQVASMLPVFNDLLPGQVPASGGGTSNFLRADGVWAAPSGGGGGGISLDDALGANIFWE